MDWEKLLLRCLLLLAVVGLAWNRSSPPVEAASQFSAQEKRNIQIFERLSPSVVYVTKLNLRREPFRMRMEGVPSGTGSGFVWDKNGTVITNYHVVKGAQAVEVTLADQSTWQAKPVGFEPDKDLAVLRIDAPADKLRPIPVGSSGPLKVGQSVYAIGNPFGFDQTLTTGVISGLGREIESVTRRPIQGVIQTDAAINPGNSGGPLLDSNGNLIGINTAIYSPSGAYAGIGFAVPIDTVKRLVPEILKYGRVAKPGLGIHPAEDYTVRRLGLQGVLIVSLVPGGPADKAGLLSTRRGRNGRLVLGDRIVGIDGAPVKDLDGLYRALDLKKVGQKVTVTVIRTGRQVKVPITLERVQ